VLRLFLIIIIVVLYFSNYHISNYFYPGNNATDLEYWWDMKVGIYSVMIIVSLYLSTLKENLKYRNVELLLKSVFTGIVINNIFVLLFLHENNYDKKDIFRTLIIIVISLYEYRRRWSKE